MASLRRRLLSMMGEWRPKLAVLNHGRHTRTTKRREGLRQGYVTLIFVCHVVYNKANLVCRIER